ncbi:MAG: hypothetical protein HYV09_21340 [Deltaproteobacteria bacterium]|nr:hypothetical protein [Deltaproteobacteria bacterium]
MRSPVRLTFTVALVAAGAVASLASMGGAADRPGAKLVYARKAGAAACPDETGFRALVAARLGYDPFRDDGERTVVVTFVREGGALRAKLELRDAAGKPAGARALSGAECAELAGSTALAVAIAIDPLGGAGGKPSASPPDASESSSVASVAPSVSVTAPPEPSPAIAPVASSAPLPATFATAALGGFVAFGEGPQMTGGLTAAVGLRTSKLSFSIEGRVDAETSRPGPAGGEVSASILAGSFVPCLHHELLLGCAIVSYGALRGAGAGVSEARSDRSPWGAVGARLGIEATIVGPLALRAYADALAVLTRTTLRVQGADAWTTPPLTFLGAVALVGHFR